ncbi:GNAT family N-acetyltransferase [Bifidobacterium sp. ESL0827]|uniref:GNAT family N-acetyltransferase n=1 Tax=Bifidobacterium sp. ESL0827 TaxID=3448583 RepID=UPI003F19B9FF|nr:GNAT family N-acetyltransferase [Bifidobacterium asteroides]
MTGSTVLAVPLDGNQGDAFYERIFSPECDKAIMTYSTHDLYPDRPSFDSGFESMIESRNPLFFAILRNPSAHGLSVGQSADGKDADIRKHVKLLDSSDLLGMYALQRIRSDVGSIEMGHVIYTHELQRSRQATEAQYLMARHVFEDLGYRRYEWKCDSLNAPSRAAALRLGFKAEGRFRNDMVYKGRTRDTDWFSILDSEWPAVKERLETWLDDDNFDQQGRQKRRLQDC